MTNSGDIGTLPLWLKLLFLLAGAVLMLTAVDVIPAHPSRFHTPHWVVFVAGLAFLAAGIISFAAKHRDTHPARYLFMVGVLMICLCLVSAGAAIYVSGAMIAIGPLLIKGTVADNMSHFMYWASAAITGMIALAVWWQWLQAVRSPNPSLQSEPDEATNPDSQK